MHKRFFTSLEMKIRALGARWGLDSEVAFREGVRYILDGVGFKVEYYQGYDSEGMVFGRPDQVELDLIIKDKKLYVGEIKSSVNKADVTIFYKKVKFYEKQTGEKVVEKVIVSPFIDPRGTRESAQAFGIRLITHPEKF